MELETGTRRVLRMLADGRALVLFACLRTMAEEKADGKDLKWGQW